MGGAVPTLGGVIEGIRSREKTIQVYAGPGDPAVGELREYFASQNVSIEHVVDETEPTRAVVTEGEAVLASVDAATLRTLVGGDTSHQPAYLDLLKHLDETTFTSYDRHQMLQASREIEDRAWRVGEGVLYAGFQRLSTFRDQVEVYRELGKMGDLSIHVYGLPDRDPPDGPFTVHATEDPDVVEKWFVVFDGGSDPTQRCALLAVERPEGFYGAWTYDPDTVDDALAALAAVE
jgi:DICT domain-containing protein